MDKIARKFPKSLNIIAVISIITGYIGMLASFLLLIAAIYQISTIAVVPNVPPVMPLVPWIQLPGLPILYFTFWIIAIFIIASVHETSHGIFSRLYKVKLKSSGFGFVGPLPAAFVEPDEKQLQKKSMKQQIAVLSAGSFSNLITAAIFLLLMFLTISLMAPATNPAIVSAPIQLVSIAKFSPAWNATLNESDGKIIEIETANETISYFSNFSDSLDKLKPGDNITINVYESNHTKIREVTITTIENPQNKSKSYFGISTQPYISDMSLKITIWFWKLFQWLFLISFFVGLFNLLPFSIFDGGRIFYLTILKITKNNKKKTERIVKITNFILLLLLFGMFLMWFIRI